MTDTNRTKKGRMLSGMRPTGKLHLGNYVGALRNWVGLQDQYECFFFIADWHALTTDYADTRSVKQNSLEVMIDYLAAGLDPERSTLFIQSHVPQHAELHLLFSMITPLGWLERVPSYKEQRENLKDKDLGTYGFLGYPLLQSADILIIPGIRRKLCSGRRRPGAARGADARGGAAFQPVLSARKILAYAGGSRSAREGGLSRAATAADAVTETARHRWPQDVEVIRQYHPAERAGSFLATEAEDHGD